jgi:hypothetical protein
VNEPFDQLRKTFIRTYWELCDGGTPLDETAVEHALRAVLAAKPAEELPRRNITIIGSDGEKQHVTLTGDATITVEVDGVPTVGFDSGGVGWWPNDDEWEPLRPGGEVTDRSVSIYGITTEAMWLDLERTLGLTRHRMGRFKPWAVDKPKVLCDSYGYGVNLDLAVRWAIAHGLDYEDQRARRHSP